MTSDISPEYLRALFRLRDSIKNLRGVNKFQVLDGYYLEQDFWYLKIPKYIVSF